MQFLVVECVDANLSQSLADPVDVGRDRNRHVDDRPRPVTRQVGTWAICPLGVMITSPFTERTVVIRRLMSSTVPSAGAGTPITEMRIRSPKPYWRSAIRKKPARHPKHHATELSAVKPTVAEILSDPSNLTFRLNFPTFGYSDIID